MAKKNTSDLTNCRLDELKNFVSAEEKLVRDIIQPAVEDHYREKVLDMRAKGFDNNRIAAMLMIPKQRVENIK